MEKTVRGAWIVHHTNKLQGVSRQSDFDSIFAAGKCGILLSAISASGEQVIDESRVSVLARASNISSLELPTLLSRLEAHGLIKVEAKAVHVLGVTNQAVLQHTSGIFESLTPTPEEQAVIELAEKASLDPCDRKDISEQLSDEFRLSAASTREVLDLSERIGFTDYQDIDDITRLYFNGNVFRRDKGRLARGLSFDSCNLWLDSGRFFAEQMITRPQKREAACRLLYVFAAFLCVGTDFILRELAFAELAEKRKTARAGRILALTRDRLFRPLPRLRTGLSAHSDGDI